MFFVLLAAFSIMIALALIRLFNGHGQGKPPAVNFVSLPNLFGVCVYSFMCHHSLPSLVTPIKNKSKIYSLFLADYSLILIFYSLLSFTGIFTFKHVLDIYTLNFQPHQRESGVEPITELAFIQYFLALFPVFTLSTNFPIIGVTLRNNLKTLCHKQGRTWNRIWFVDRICFPVMALIPPVIVAFITDDVEALVGITGSYAGAAIQYVVPAALVYTSRKLLAESNEDLPDNPHTSPFRHKAWVFISFGWAVACVILVTVNHIVTGQ